MVLYGKIKNKYDNLIKVQTKLLRSINKYSNPPAYADEEDIESYMTTLIKRFELTYELTWKFLKLYLKNQLQEKSESSRDVFRKSFDNNIITESEIKKLLDIIDDRNATAHDYNEKYARALCEKVIKIYNPIFIELLPTLKKLIA